MTYELLKNAPPQDSEEFIDYLKAHNRVISETEHWLIISNCKYDKPERPWFTAFWKHTESMRKSIQFDMSFLTMLDGYSEWNWLKKSKEKQTVPGRFHIHLYK